MNHEKVVLLLNYATVKVINCCVWLEVCYFAGKRNCVLTFILRPPGKSIQDNITASGRDALLFYKPFCIL